MASLALPSFGRDELEVLSELMDEELFVDTDFGPAPASLGVACHGRLQFDVAARACEPTQEIKCQLRAAR